MMHLAITFNQNYLSPACVMLTSVFANNPHKMTVHVIATGLTDQQTADFRLFLTGKGCTVHFYKIDHRSLKSLSIKEGSYFSLANYYRLFFPHLIHPQIEKLLYLDADTIVLKDLFPLYQTSFSEVLAAVQDPYFEIRTDLGLTSKEQYFNTGVLLINTKAWREQSITEKALDFASKNPAAVKYVDQDALSAVLKGAWYRLDKRYNLTRGDTPVQVPVKNLIKDVVVVHYTTGEKPWLCLSRNKLRFLYRRYQKQWNKNEKKYRDFSPHKLKDFLRIRMKEAYFDRGIHKILPVKSWLRIKHDY